MSERLNMQVDDGIGALLTTLAGGERKKGAYLSELIRGISAAQGTPGADVRLLFNAVMGVTSQIAGIDGRLAVLENQMQHVTSQVSALIAKGAA